MEKELPSWETLKWVMCKTCPLHGVIKKENIIHEENRLCVSEERIKCVRLKQKFLQERREREKNE